MSFYTFQVSFYPQIVYLQQRIDRWKYASEVWGLIAKQYIDVSVSLYPVNPSQLEINNAQLWLQKLYWIFPFHYIRQTYQTFLDEQNIDTVTASQTSLQLFFTNLTQYIPELLI